MKLHLPPSLRRSVITAMVASMAWASTAEAGTLHADVSIQTYTDFAQNMGRYAVGNTNALLNHIREEEGGITITYTGGQEDFTMTTPMIDFGCIQDIGASAAMGDNWLVTVAHNGVQNPTFTRYTLLDSSESIHYYGIEYRHSTEFRHTPGNDFKLTRMSKLITDVTGTMPYGSSTGDYASVTGLTGEYLYRAGGGYMYRANYDGSRYWLYSCYGYITGAVDTISGLNYDATTGHFGTTVNCDRSQDGINITSPLPFDSEPGDSGSPGWVWNAASGQYEYLVAHHAAGGYLGTNSHGKGNGEWAMETMVVHDVNITPDEGSNTICLNKIDRLDETRTDDSVEGVVGHLYSGAVTDADGTELARYYGVQSGINLWKDLSALKDTQNWYAYNNTYLNAREQVSSNYALSYADLFYNSNLVISAASATETQYVVLNDTVDLGIGYVRFQTGEGMESATFVVKSEDAESNLLNSAGFIVDQGASVHLQLTNPASYMREWRKTGEGDLYIEGQGNNDILLNIGGNGKTVLQREGGYAAYNVLVNNGSTLVIQNVNQIERDLTFGSRGGTLDMNGNSMTWNNDNSANAEGFTIHALDEQAIISNTAGSSTLTWTQGGEQKWLGSFEDTQTGSLTFIYNGGDHLTLNTIHTDLTHHADSGIEVRSGTLSLQGTNTVHAIGSETGTSLNRYFHEDDWHYADASANIKVTGGTFELGSHARLTGDINVQSGTFVMREGVKHQMEYIEGGYRLENTDAISDFFGLKGNVSLAAGTRMEITFSEGTDSTLVYGGNISGEGSLSVDTALDADHNGGTLHLTGDHSGHTGQKTVLRGGLYATTAAALGDTSTNKWVVAEQAWLASDSFTSADTIRQSIDASSSGVVALTRDVQDSIARSEGHATLIVGAAEGMEVHYGTAEQSLAAINGMWTLGGGGGNLVVDFMLTGNNQLVLGNEYGKGNVHLTNTSNDFSGGITFAGGVTLTAEEGAMGNSRVALSYTNRLNGRDTSSLYILSEGADGVLLMDSGSDSHMNLSSYSGVTLGSLHDCRFSGTITVAEGEAYRFGGTTTRFTVDSHLESGRDIIIDGQTYVGGSVVFTNAQEVDGSVTIIGRDTAKTHVSEGSATLGFETDNALSNASSFSVKDGGVIDLMGTSQTLRNMELAETGKLVDSSADRSGVLTLTGENHLRGDMTVDIDNVVVRDGTLTLHSYFCTTMDGTITLNHATLNLNGYMNLGNLTLQEGAVVENSWPYGNHKVEGRSVENLSSGSDARTLMGSITLDAAGALTMNVGDHKFKHSGVLSGSGELAINTNATHLQAVELTNDNSGFSGHLIINGTGSTPGDGTMTGLTLSSAASAGAGTITLNHAMLSITTANTADTVVRATLDVGEGGAALNGAGGAAYYFSGLSGAGTLNVAGYRTGSADAGLTVNFRGDMRGFSGHMVNSHEPTSIIFGGEGISYHEMTGTAGNDALRLFDASDSARLTGASGTTDAAAMSTYEFTYADNVVLNAQVSNAHVLHSGTGTLVLSEDNNSTGELRITGGGTVQLGEGGERGTWQGGLYGAAGSTLVNMNSSQAGVTFSSVQAYEGSLALMQGSKLTMGSGGSFGYTLAEGVTLDVISGSRTGTGAELNISSLTLAGGTLAFSGQALSGQDSAALLLTQGVVSADSSLTEQTISLHDTSMLSGGNYLLVSGDWSELSGTDFSVEGMVSIFSSSVTADSTGLYLTLTLEDGVTIWNGSAGKNEWNSSVFGSSTQVPAAGETIYFRDSASERHVNITGEVEAGKLVFNTAESDYTLGGTGRLSATELEMEGSGMATLNAGVRISGAGTIAAGSELRVADFSVFESTASLSGAGLLSVDAGSATGSLAADLSDLATLQLLSGRYETATAIGEGNPAINVRGGQLYLSGGTHANAISLSGTGWAGDEQPGAALRLEGGANVSGALSLEEDATVAVTGTATISGSIDTAGHTLTKTGDSTLILNTSAVSGNLDVQEGMLRIDGQPTSGIQTLTLRENTTLQLQSALSKFGADNIVMEDGSRINLYNGNYYGAYFMANISLAGTATIAASTGGSYTHVQGSIKGDGTLSLTTAGQTHSWKISSTISDAEDGRLAVVANSNVTLSGDNSYSGGTTLEGYTLITGHANALGGGALLINGGSLQQNSGLLLSTLDSSVSSQINAGNYSLTLGNNTSADTEASFIGSFSGQSLEKIGAGTQELAGSFALNGALVVKGGTLTLRDSQVTGAINVEEGAALTLGGELTLNHSITSAGSVSLESGVHFTLNSKDFNGYDASTNTYTLIRGGSIDGQEGSFSFTVNGISSSELPAEKYTISLTSDRLSITMIDIMRELIWNAQGDGAVWSNSSASENWTIDGSSSTSCASDDSVTFGSAGVRAVSVDAAGVEVSSMVVKGKDYVFSGGAILSQNDVTIEAGASASFNNALTIGGKLTVNGSAAFGDVELAGTLTSSGSLTINGAAEFTAATITGALTVGEGGSVTLNDGDSERIFNGTVTLAEGATLTVDNTINKRSQFNNALNLTGNATICYDNTTGSQSDLLIASTLNGNGHTITKTGAGLLWLAPTSMSNVSFMVEKGKLRVGGAAAKAIPTGIDTITMRNGTELSFTADSSTFATNLTLDGGSSIDLKGTNGNEETYTFTGEMNLTGGTVTIAPNASRTLIVDGKVTGSGRLSVGNSGTLTLTLNNAANDFAGGITANSAVTINLGASSAAGTGDISLTNANAGLNVTGSADSYGQMQNRITSAGTFTVTSGKVEMTASGSSVKSATVAQGASLKLAEAASLSMADAMTVEAKPALARSRSAQAEAMLENVAMTGASMTAANTAAPGMVSDAAVSLNATAFSMSGLVLENSAVTLAATELTLSDVVMSSTTFNGLSTENSTMQMEDVTFALGSDAYTLVDGSLYGETYAGKTVAVYNITNFSNVTLSGSMLMDIGSAAAIASQPQTAAQPDFYAFDFGNTSGVAMNNFSLSANIGPGGSVESGIQAGNTAYLISNATAAIPEPGSAALALLGLTGLAMRRRRK